MPVRWRRSSYGPDVDPREDRELLLAHVAGDPDAFGVLVRRHQDRMWAVALRTTGDPQEAADALQDALIKAYRSAKGFRSEAAVTTWLHRIVVNSCLDRLRRRAVRRTVPLPDGDEPDDPARSAGPPAPGPGEVTEAHERRDRVLAALRAIPDDQRAALVLVDMEGCSVAEAAQLLGVPAGTVKSRCARGRTRLAGLLGDLRPEPGPGAGNRSGPGRVTPEDQPAPRPDEGRTVP